MRGDPGMTDGDERVDRLTARLFASVGPLPRSEARKARVLVVVEAEPVQSPWLSIAITAGVAILIGLVVMRRPPETPVRSPQPAVMVPSPVGPAPPVEIEQTAPASREHGPLLPIPSVAPHSSPPQRLTRPAVKLQPSPAPHADAPTLPSPPPDVPPAPPVLPVPSAADDDGHTLVVEAKGALRIGDAVRAASLAARYRALHPDGIYDEEAQVIAIVAAVQKRDPAARTLALKYLAQYPRGRFLDVAREAARRFAPDDGD